MDIVWANIVGFFAGNIAMLVTPGGPNPRVFILTTVLGIVGAVVATYLGQIIHLYGPGDSANFLAQIIGAIIILLIWRQEERARRGLLPDERRFAIWRPGAESVRGRDGEGYRQVRS